MIFIDRLKDLQVETERIKNKESKLQRIMDKIQRDTDKCTVEMAEVKKAMQDAEELAASPEKLVSEFLVKVLRWMVQSKLSIFCIKSVNLVNKY